MFYKLLPALKEYIWAGNKLKKLFNKETDLDKISESWEFSLNDDGLTNIVIDNETCILKDALSKLNLGLNIKENPKLLIKLIDSSSDLSIQVHPNDDYAIKNYNQLGKTEMWYIIDKEPGSFIYLGFNDNYTKEQVESALNDGSIIKMLNKVEVEKGKFYLIPSGTIHAIGSGITLYEIQENSTLTFRLYDYDRVDKDGNKRELHINDALNVLDYSKYSVDNSKERGVKATEYFETQKYIVKDSWDFKNNNNSFAILTCIKGKMSLDNVDIVQGDTYFIEASTSIKVTGEAEFIVSRIPDYGIGLDVGGTSVKGAIIDDLGHKISEIRIPNEYPLTFESITNNMANAYYSLINNVHFSKNYFKSIGVGFPGNIDTYSGIVKFSNNLGLKDYPCKEMLSGKIGINVIVDNDANCAALGEYFYTSNKRFHDITFITLGTGVGGGIIINNKLFKGGQGSITELGHMKVKSDNFKCTCGQYGCLESLLSLARIKHDTQLLREDPTTGIYDLISEDDPAVKIFSIENNEAAKKYVQKFCSNLLLGLINICNILQPQAIILGGGVSNKIEKFIPELEYKMNKYKFDGFDAPKVKLIMASLNNDAGAYGAAALTKSE